MNLRFWRKASVRAREFILEDADGRERAALRMDAANNTLLLFRGPSGDVRTYIGVTPDGTPRVTLLYAGSKGRIELEANDHLNSAAVLISSPEGGARIALAIAPNGVPTIVLFDKNGEPVFAECGMKQSDGSPPSAGSFDWNSILHI
jgi:hypothetical protein